MILDDDAPSITITHSGGAEITITDNDLTIKQGGSIVVTSSSVKINDTSLEVS
jgi:hypothetical protein